MLALRPRDPTSDRLVECDVGFWLTLLSATSGSIIAVILSSRPVRLKLSPSPARSAAVAAATPLPLADLGAIVEFFFKKKRKKKAWFDVTSCLIPTRVSARSPFG